MDKFSFCWFSMHGREKTWNIRFRITLYLNFKISVIQLVLIVLCFTARCWYLRGIFSLKSVKQTQFYAQLVNLIYIKVSSILAFDIKIPSIFSFL